jgi:hypothetical protein
VLAKVEELEILLKNLLISDEALEATTHSKNRLLQVSSSLQNTQVKSSTDYLVIRLSLQIKGRN